MIPKYLFQLHWNLFFVLTHTFSRLRKLVSPAEAHAHKYQPYTEAPDQEVNHGEERDAAIAETVLSFVEVCQRLFIDYFDSDDLPVFLPLLNRLKLREKSIDFVEDNYDQKFIDLAPLSTILRDEEKFGVFPADLNKTIKSNIICLRVRISIIYFRTH